MQEAVCRPPIRRLTPDFWYLERYKDPANNQVGLLLAVSRSLNEMRQSHEQTKNHG